MINQTDIKTETLYDEYYKKGDIMKREINVVIEKSGEYRLTDMGNAQRFVREHFNEVRYCYERNCWYVWNGVIWTPDKTGLVNILAKKTIGRLYQEASSIEEEKKRKNVLDWARKSESLFKRNTMIKDAQAEMVISIKQMNKENNLIACFNETISLDTGTVFQNQRENYLTKQLYVVYDSDANCYSWNSFLSMVFENDAEKMEYFQKLVGYMLTGNQVTAIVILLPNGSVTERNIITHILRSLFGDYTDRLSNLDMESTKKTSDKYADTKIRDEFINELKEELSGILNWTLEGLRKYEEKGLIIEPVTASAYMSPVV